MKIRDLPPAMQAEARAKMAALKPPKPKGAARVVPEDGWREAITVAVPMPEDMVNRSGHGKSRHWRVLNDEKQAYHAYLDGLRLVGSIAPPPPMPVVRCTLSATLYLGNAMDDDNALARTKPLTDWLVRNGYLFDDRRKYARWPSPPDQVVSRKRAYAIHLTITPLGA